MLNGRFWRIAIVCASPFAAASAADAQAPPAPPALANPSGGELVGRNCFQCHTDSMFRDQRQDRRAWLATIYRMVGRGGQWAPADIDAMADYLGVALGPNVEPLWTKSK